VLGVGLPEPVGGKLGEAAEAGGIGSGFLEVALALAGQQMHPQVDRPGREGDKEQDVEH
jgi:hypothetical protein